MTCGGDEVDRFATDDGIRVGPMLLERWDSGVDLQASIGVAMMMEETLGRRLVGQVMRAGPRLKLHGVDAVRTAQG
jgi:hypothetical protein